MTRAHRVWLGIALGATVAILVGSVALAVGVARHTTAARGPAGTGMMGGVGYARGAGGPGGGPGVPGRGPGAVGGPGAMGGPGMMGGTTGMAGAVWLAGDGHTIASIAAARARATTAATPYQLRPGEVIQFSNGFYVELKDASGASATEVMVDPANGAVTTEPGPAMMWNTAYGMHRTGTVPATVSADRARQLADAWLAANRPGRHAEAPDQYPGYYTMETSTGGGIEGMLSVNAGTGQVWYHTWHGTFVAREDS